MEQNFDDELISERVPVAAITARLKDLSPTPRANIDLNHILHKHKTSNPKSKRTRTSSIIQSSSKYEKEKEEKIKAKQKEEESRILKQCTFKPAINKSSEKKRTLKQFLESQDNFMNKVETKRTTLQKQMKQNDPTYSFHPKVNHNKSQKKGTPIHQRLYNISKFQPSIERSHTESDFIPSITSRGKTIERGLPFHQHLYTDAMRRQREQIKRQQHSLSPEPRSKSLKNDKLVAQKIIKQYYGHLESLQIESKMTFQQFVKMSYKMGFIIADPDDIQQSISQRQKQLLIQAYEFIQAPTIRNVCVYMLAICGIFNINPINFSQSQTKITEFELTFTTENGRKLQNHFDLFFRNRLSIQSTKTISYPDEPSFKPSINQRSQILAGFHRSKMLEQTSVMLQSHEIDFPRQGKIVLSHADLLHLNKLGKQVQNLKKKQDSQVEEMKHCTFNPNSSIRDLSSSNIGIKKCEQLYQKSKLIHRQEKSNIDRQFQKYQKQCTFKPKVHNAPSRLELGVEPAPDFNKSIARLFDARKQRLQRESKLLPPNSSICKSMNNTIKKSKSSNLGTPLEKNVNTINEGPSFLVIDVNLGDSTQQIHIRSHDVNEGERLGHEFADHHRLDAVSRQKLIQILKIQICNALNQITQQDQWSEDS